MKPLTSWHVCCFCAALAAVAGCNQTEQTAEPPSVNAWVMQKINDIAIHNAIVRQQTLFPYHFVPRRAALNELGEQDLAVLVRHCNEHPGELTLSVRRGDASRELYKDRVATVENALKKAGIPTEHIAVVDAPAGGEGMPSESVLKIKMQQEQPPTAAAALRGRTLTIQGGQQ